MSIVAPPTAEVLEIADLVDIGVSRFLQAAAALPSIGKFESAVEALNLFSLAIRDLEALVTLARTDLVLLPAAQVLARAILEISVKGMWLLHPEDLMEREIRWLAHVKEEERVLERLTKSPAVGDQVATNLGKQLRQLKDFRTGVASKLPDGYRELPGNPSMDQMLQDLGQPHLYGAYIMLAQFVHGGHSATWLYRRGLGIKKEVGEYLSLTDWYIPLHAATMTLSLPAAFVLQQLGSAHAEIFDFSLRRRARIAFEGIKS
jgi:hypothetical protein